MTIPERTSKQLVWVGGNLVFLSVAVPALVLGFSATGLVAPVAFLLALAAWKGRLWPAVAISALFVFGVMVPFLDACYGPGCDGSVRGAFAASPALFAIQIGIISIAIMAGAAEGRGRRRRDAINRLPG